MVFLTIPTLAQKPNTAYLQNQTLTYDALLAAYRELDSLSPEMKLFEYCCADNGMSVHLLVINKNRNFERPQPNRTNQTVFLVMNGIHPGECEGIDASLLWAQEMCSGKIPIPANTTICIIPVYNVEGMLNRRANVRTNQNGPEEKGFRGNGQNLDLNRDFIKADAHNTLAFYELFHYWQPDVFLDTHTSNGADYQYTMTLIATQKEKLGGAGAAYLYNTMLPALYSDMKLRKWEMIPYVHVFGKSPDENGYDVFIESPRYSSGYAALFGTLSFVAETHMLKPYADRVKATYSLLNSLCDVTNKNSKDIRSTRLTDLKSYINKKQYGTNFRVTKSEPDSILFKGYTTERIPSKIGTYQRLYYNRKKPYARHIPYYHSCHSDYTVSLPQAYIVPQSWQRVLQLLQANQVEVIPLANDTMITCQAWYIKSFQSSATPYESHHYNGSVQAEKKNVTVTFSKGDYIIYTNQTSNRFIAEVLNPMCEDSYFAWNFFDAVLNAKEGFSDYAFEEDADKLLAENPELRKKTEEWKQQNPDKLNNPYEVLGFIFRNSLLYEPEHNRVPVFMIE